MLLLERNQPAGEGGRWLSASQPTVDSSSLWRCPLPRPRRCLLPPHTQAQQEGRAPWALSFSFGRGLQASVLKLWSDAPPSMAAALAKANAAAARGAFEGLHPSITSAAGATLHETFRGWRTDVAPAPVAAAQQAAGREQAREREPVLASV
jgi:hypothetical protein